MGRRGWEHLPAEVRRGIEERVGSSALQVQEQTGPTTTAFSGAIHAGLESVFVKVVSQDVQAESRARINEERLSGLLPRVAPRVLWRFYSFQWVVTGYEYVDGHPARLYPGSLDIEPVVNLLADMAAHPPPGSVHFDTLAARWSRIAPWRTLGTGSPKVLDAWERRRIRDFIDLESFVFEVLNGGTATAHTAIDESNLLVSRHGLRLVGWTWACRAPSWVDSALLAIRLVEAGHTPEQAEAWVRRTPAWRNAAADSLDAFAVSMLGLWVLRGNPGAGAARRYARYRLIGTEEL
ncbi:hypothetical protein [Amycolatopsis samaneae]|uniref:Aminoglycoside phosphotransferase domain-containing protein n=1 Tax=Amycolatopsis samaneae TaxID=664691 RepID=A0ABW5GKF6_9PSEU